MSICSLALWNWRYCFDSFRNQLGVLIRMTVPVALFRFHIGCSVSKYTTLNQIFSKTVGWIFLIFSLMYAKSGYLSNALLLTCVHCV